MSYDEEYVGTLWAHMNRVLEIVVQTFGQAGVALPDKQYITFGQPVHDCEQLTVQFQQMYVGPPGDQAQTAQPCDNVRTAALVVEIVRCVPGMSRGGYGPSDEQMNAFAKLQAEDAYMLITAGANVNALNGVIADISAGEVSGQYQAMQLSLVAVVDDFG